MGLSNLRRRPGMYPRPVPSSSLVSPHAHGLCRRCGRRCVGVVDPAPSTPRVLAPRAVVVVGVPACARPVPSLWSSSRWGRRPRAVDPAPSTPRRRPRVCPRSVSSSGSSSSRARTRPVPSSGSSSRRGRRPRDVDLACARGPCCRRRRYPCARAACAVVVVVVALRSSTPRRRPRMCPHPVSSLGSSSSRARGPCRHRGRRRVGVVDPTPLSPPCPRSVLSSSPPHVPAACAVVVVGVHARARDLCCRWGRRYVEVVDPRARTGHGSQLPPCGRGRRRRRCRPAPSSS